MITRAVITGVGAYLPEKILTNRDLESMMDTTDAWIRERTGITQRHIAGTGEYTSHLAAHAARAALTQAGVTAGDVNLLLVATTTPDETLPATATRVQHAIGMTGGAAFDLQAACSGFIYGLSVARAYITSGMARRVLVIGAETFSRIVDWKDRGTCVLFGDGAGAVLVEASDADRGILSVNIHADGRHTDILRTNGGVSTTGAAGVLQMQGAEVFRHAVGKMAASLEEAARDAGIALAEVDFVIPHQANKRILAAVAEKCGLVPEKLVSTVEIHANTSAASIPLALAHLQAGGQLKPGHIIAMPALGAGLTWGCAMVKW